MTKKRGPKSESSYHIMMDESFEASAAPLLPAGTNRSSPLPDRVDYSTAAEGITETMTTEEANNNGRLWLAAVVICHSSFLMGYSFSVFNACIAEGAPGSILNDVALSVEEQELATALTILGAWAGSVVANYPIEALGRRRVVLINNIFFLVGALLCSFSISKFGLFIGRLSLGFGDGIAMIVVPILLAEIAPPHSRGQLTTLHQLLLTVGILAAGLMGWVFVDHASSGWKYANVVAVLPVGSQLILSSVIPESSRWLVQHNKLQEAKLSIKMLFPHVSDEEVDAEVASVATQLRSAGVSHEKANWRDVFGNKKPLIVGVGLTVLQAVSGINTVIFYSAKIFGYAGVQAPIVATVTVGIVNVIATIVSVYLIDKCGRVTLLLWSAISMTISLAVLSVTLLIHTSARSSVWQSGIALFATLTYVAGFAIGFGACVWVVLGEIMPTRIRSKAMGLAMSINNLINLGVAMSTLSIIQLLGGGSSESQQKRGVAILFLIFCVINFGSIFFVKLSVPETKGRALDSADELHGETKPLKGTEI